MKNEARCLERVRELETMLRERVECTRAIDRFESLFYEEPAFKRSCWPTPSPVLEKLFAPVVTGRRALWARPMARYAPASLVHGMAVIDGWFVNALYFEESDLGLGFVGRGFEHRFFRFSKLELEVGLVTVRLAA